MVVPPMVRSNDVFFSSDLVLILEKSKCNLFRGYLLWHKVVKLFCRRPSHDINKDGEAGNNHG